MATMEELSFLALAVVLPGFWLCPACSGCRQWPAGQRPGELKQCKQKTKVFFSTVSGSQQPRLLPSAGPAALSTPTACPKPQPAGGSVPAVGRTAAASPGAAPIYASSLCPMNAWYSSSATWIRAVDLPCCPSIVCRKWAAASACCHTHPPSLHQPAPLSPSCINSKCRCSLHRCSCKRWTWGAASSP